MRGALWTPLPAVAGLAGSFGFAPAVVAEEEPLARLREDVAEMTAGVALVHLASPLLLARHGQWEGWRRRLAAIECELLAPLVREGRRVIITGGMAVDPAGVPCWRPSPWVMGGGPARSASSWLKLWQRRPTGGALPATSCLESWLT